MIVIEDVSKTFKRRRVLDSLSLEIGDGERIALVGCNGAGKTTLIRVLLGEYHCQGKVELWGSNPRKQREEILERIGFVPQLPPPLRMPVGELVRFAARVCGSTVERMEEVGHRLGLEISEVRRQAFSKLSGGQKQKVLIAIALGRDCDLLLMDEPAANLDPEARAGLFGLLAEQKDSAMIISSHRLDEVASLVNRVIELDYGKVVLDDRVAEETDLESRLECEIVAARSEDAFAAALNEWGFRAPSDGMVWKGSIPSADKLRFMGLLSRYSGVIQDVSMRKQLLE